MGEETTSRILYEARRERKKQTVKPNLDERDEGNRE